MMTVVLPALIASRTSIHVISSSQTVFGVGIGFGVSAQLYGLDAQLPPPRFWLGCCAGFCADALDAASIITPKASAAALSPSIVSSLSMVCLATRRAECSFAGEHSATDGYHPLD